MIGSPLLEVRVWGDYACFTRPEFKAERFSANVCTPSAARGILSSVLWKPEIRWRVHEIHVLEPIRTFSMVRNEVISKASVDRARSGYYANEDRAQRHTLALRDVAYLIRAEIVLAPHSQDEHPAKYRDQFRRRVERGQCFTTPYLGCREFAASFGPPVVGEKPIDVTEDLGRMLFDLRYDPEANQALPVFFDARLERGVLRIPQELYAQVEVNRGSG
jgi:CRISPR-associated protein Cas5d